MPAHHMPILGDADVEFDEARRCPNTESIDAGRRCAARRATSRRQNYMRLPFIFTMPNTASGRFRMRTRPFSHERQASRVISLFSAILLFTGQKQ